jgi:hypothetical protein
MRTTPLRDQQTQGVTTPLIPGATTPLIPLNQHPTNTPDSSEPTPNQHPTNTPDSRSDPSSWFNGLTIRDSTVLVGSTDLKYYSYWGIVLTSPFQRLETLASFVRRVAFNVRYVRMCRVICMSYRMCREAHVL